MLKKFVVFIFSLSIAISAFAQKDERTLFTVAGKPVTVEEFKYIYTKNNGKKADFSMASIEENLNLYKNFKLKVQSARDMKLDTVPSTKQEMAGYRKQLSDSYLIDREVTDKLIKEAYERSTKDLHIKHIMVVLKPDAPVEDTIVAYKKILAIKDRLLKGEDFTKVARESSEDKTASENGGDLGFFTALFPSGYYNIENAVYALKPGNISEPIRTNQGYHIFKLIEVRDARGELEVAHILLRKTKSGENKNYDAQVRIDSIYHLLTKGASFDDLAEKFSEDKGSSTKGGYIGFFGINRYERSFEDNAFALAKDGDFTKPTLTEAGWHIIKRISARPIGDFDSMKKRLEPKVKKDARYEEARAALLVKIKKACGLKENRDAMNAFIQPLDDTYFAHDWKGTDQNLQSVLFNLDNGDKLTVAEFVDFLKANTRKRMSMKQTNDVRSAVMKMYDDNLNTALLKYEESKLEQKYPEFKSLMREYEEGTLLFAASEKMVWKKASEDSTGLKKYFDANLKGKYKWERRVETTQYSQRQATEEEMRKAYDMLKADPKANIDMKFNTERKLINVETKTYEKGKNAQADKMLWNVGELSELYKDEKSKMYSFMTINKVMEPGDKTLEESRGYSVADYGDFLDKEWVKELQKKYTIKVDKKVLDSLVKK